MLRFWMIYYDCDDMINVDIELENGIVKIKGVSFTIEAIKNYNRMQFYLNYWFHLGLKSLIIRENICVFTDDKYVYCMIISIGARSVVNHVK